MRTKAEELLYMLLWSCDMLVRPSFRNVTDSFEGWAYRKGFLRQLQRLEKRRWIESQVAQSGDRLHRLTEEGRMHALGGRDPIACWKRRWDQRWRLVLFDVPESRNTLRDKLRRYLQSRGFGYLQHSVWISPHPVTEERRLLANIPTEVGSLIVLEGRPCTGETDEAIVAAAWDFSAINARYAAYHVVLAARPQGHLETPAAAAEFQHWLGQERQAWQAATEHDPFLPESLLPNNYAGQRLWSERLEAMAAATEQMMSFQGC